MKTSTAQCDTYDCTAYAVQSVMKKDSSSFRHYCMEHSYYGDDVEQEYQWHGTLNKWVPVGR